MNTPAQSMPFRRVSLPDELFALGETTMRAQAAFVPPPILENNPTRLAAIADEIYSEGRAHKNTRTQRHE